VDLSKFKTSDWLKIGGGVVFFIAFFLKWWKAPEGFDFGFTGSDYFFTGVIPFILLVAIGVLTVLAALGKFHLPASMPAPILYIAGSALSTLLVLIRFTGPGHGAPDESGLDRGIGLILALIAAIAALVGSFMGFKESGGDFNDLKDMNKIKGAFQGGGGDSAPPPPPPGMTPPPPPPPPA
jgi:hypothetical protein